MAVLGAGGFTGGESVRLLLEHPRVDLVHLSSERQAGVPIGRALPAVRNHPRSAGLTLAPLEAMPEVDVALCCLPGGELPGRLDAVAARAEHVVNLAGDFRLTDPAERDRHYPATPAGATRFTYHVPEFGRPVGRFLNLPGCMAVAGLYALHPLFAADLVDPEVVVDAKTGSTGGGRDGAGHAGRSGNALPHKLHGHRHRPELAAALAGLTGARVDLQFSTYSLDVARGVLVSAYATAKPGVTDLDVRRAYAKAYGRTPFVRYRPGARPALKTVVGSNVAEVGVALDGRRCVAVAALDNLVKGAAGQAVQTVNQLNDWDPALGLPFTAVAP